MAESITLCRVEFGKKGIEFESSESRGLTLNQVIEDDKNYGMMVPANGKYFTYTVLNEDDEFTQKEAEKLGINIDMTTGTGWTYGGPVVGLNDDAGRLLIKEFKLSTGKQLN